MLEANDMVEAKLAEIRERKMYEMKRMFAAKMEEGVGGLTLAQVQARKELGWKRASEVLPDPRESRSGSTTFHSKPKKAKKKLKEEIDPEQVKAEKERLKKAGKAYPQYGGSSSDEGGPTPETQAPEVKISSDEVQTSRRKRLAQQGLKMLKARSGGNATSDRYGAALGRATELERRGRKGAVAKIKKAYRIHRVKQGIKAVGTGIKNAGKRFMDSPIMRDLHSIGTRNI